MCQFPCVFFNTNDMGIMRLPNGQAFSPFFDKWHGKIWHSPTTSAGTMNMLKSHLRGGRSMNNVLAVINVWTRTKFTKASLVLNPFCIPPQLNLLIFGFRVIRTSEPSTTQVSSDFRFHSCFGHDTILVQSTCEKAALHCFGHQLWNG